MKRKVGSTASLTTVACDAVTLDHRLPVAHRRAAERIDPDLDAGAADRLHVDDIGEVGDIGADIVVAMHAGSLARPVIGNPRDALQIVFEIAVGGALDGAGDVGVRRSAIGRVVFEAAILRRIVRRRDHDAIGEAALAALVGGEDGVRDHRRRRVAVVLVDHHLDAVRREHFQRARQRRLRQRMGVDPDEQRPVDAAGLAMIADRLADREDMVLVEGVVERGAAMPGGAERNPLRRYGRVGLARKIGRHQPRHIGQHRRLGGLAGERIYVGGHWVPLNNSGTL